MDQYGSSDDVKNNMQKLYGWTVADFENNIVKPDMYQEKLYDDFKNKDAGFAAAKAKIEQAQKDLNSGSDFQTVVGKYSEGDSAKDKGDLGWFGSEEMLPEIAQVAFSIDTGKNSDIIESSLGYHIIQILDKKNEDGEDKVHIQQIFVRTPSFSDWLAEKEKATRIYIPIREFSWNKDSEDVDFRDDAMKQFEEKVKENPNGDISVLF
jgi:parvulin-like peptidyl-prolyl isomerase